MPTEITLSELRPLLDRGAQLVEVLPKDSYERLHIPGATNLPLIELDEQAIDDLDPSQPIVAYCHDYQ